ncbi:manganese/zinc/iron transport system permease protein [Evansella caseinilytica]|uniref:Manganese transport system membrane protein MntC n=1 Tax=Evansella caseinilytica TaxID=1503961 RepID=A0A1H3HM16_9BACI|nr:metal ABC transporter permease [Evansella caseinilytica]SDY16502.1 manganese/zinc/iron transport system permease protein [Evansella caseinilytica]
MFSLLPSNTQWVLFSTMMLGIAAGMVGCLAYWKKQSLMSDALSHAALPGVVLAFLLLGEKNLLVLICGAAVSALIGAMCIQWIQSVSRIKEDTSMGMILSVFFGLGIMLLTIANRSGGNQSGLDGFIFGQAASMIRKDVYIMSVLALLVIFIGIIAFKEWKIYLFDPSFAKGIGLSVKTMNAVYTFVLVLTIVIGIQAVGVILMAALLIIPAISARYWAHSFRTMLLLSALFGGVSGAGGTLVSTYGAGWPTGPFIVITSSAIFLVSMIFGAEKGMLLQFLQHRKHKRDLLVNWNIRTAEKEGER